MDMFEKARTICAAIRMCNTTQSELAKRLGVSQSYIANKIRLLNLSENMRKKILDAGLSERHARALLRLDSEEARAMALDKMISLELTVKESEAVIDFIYDEHMPKFISRADECDRISTFKDTLRTALNNLCALGVKATRSEDHYGKKTYITICIEEV